jgi:hypothetical protein
VLLVCWCLLGFKIEQTNVAGQKNQKQKTKEKIKTKTKIKKQKIYIICAAASAAAPTRLLNAIHHRHPNGP